MIINFVNTVNFCKSITIEVEAQLIILKKCIVLSTVLYNYFGTNPKMAYNYIEKI